jgi:mannose-6-phosphate isomerase-like protein (cupin superfamily)
VTRQILFSDPRLKGELRYFEVSAGGYSTLEKHEHMHAVLVLRGGGTCLVGDVVRDLQQNDLVTVPPWTWHQFRATKDEPLGFLCMVNSERDRPQLPSEGELEALKSDPKVRDFLDGK